MLRRDTHRQVATMLQALSLILFLFMVGCTASQHAGVATIRKPQLTDNREAVWLSYWQDQFDAYEGNVVPPQSGTYPQVAIDAWQRAKLQWDHKVETASANNSIIIYSTLAILPIILLVFLI
jgi:hypothetical protein